MILRPQLKELLLQSLEHEYGGVLLYQTALECVLNDDLRKEWEKYLAQTQTHVELLTTACEQLGLDPDEMTPGRKIVQHNGKSLAVAMKMALAASDPPAAELVACECIVLAETKDHFDWELIGAVRERAHGRGAVGAESRVRSGRGRGGRAPLSHQGLVPGAVAEVARHEGGLAAARKRREM